MPYHQNLWCSDTLKHTPTVLSFFFFFSTLHVQNTSGHITHQCHSPPTQSEIFTSTMTESQTSNPLASFSFPRTGKRGVPQQFPRRLYEMLDSETKLSEASSTHPKVICWSSSGKAFRIYDTNEFANVVLPKYFRTKKFSSFQRNLNLYGFTKIRRGPDVDMYAHPAFLRDTPETLLQLRKVNNGARKHRPTMEVSMKQNSRTVSPLSAGHHADIADPASSSPVSTGSVPNFIVPRASYWGNNNNNQSIRSTLYTSATPILPATRADDRGKLDLLALAMEHQAAAH